MNAELRQQAAALAISTAKAAIEPEAKAKARAYRESAIKTQVEAGVSFEDAVAVIGKAIQGEVIPRDLKMFFTGLDVWFSLDDILNADDPAKFDGQCVADLDGGDGLNRCKFYLNRKSGRPAVHQIKNGTLTTFENPKRSANDTSFKERASFNGSEGSRPLSEVGNALRIVDHVGCNIRYIHDRKEFLVWDGDRFFIDKEGSVIRNYAGVVLPEIIYREGFLHPEDATPWVRHAFKSQTERVITATVKVYQDFPDVRISFTELDANLYSAGIDEGRSVIDLRDCTVRKATQKDLITNSLGVSHVGDACDAVRWVSFLQEIFEGDDELIGWLKRLLGYALTGLTNEKILVFLNGLGDNGKSAFEVLLTLLFGSYNRVVAPATLEKVKRTAGACSTDLVALIGGRLAVCSELEETAVLGEGFVKNASGGGSIECRALYCPPMSFTPQFLLMCDTNHLPMVKGTDHAIWSRIRVIPFNRVFTAGEKDLNLLDKLRAEMPHVLAWMLEGLMDYWERGLSDVPVSVADAGKAYRKEQDLVGQWLDERCSLLDDAETEIGVLYTSYAAWCRASGAKALGKMRLGRSLGRRGFESRGSNGKTLWAGIYCLPPEQPGVSAFLPDYSWDPTD
jgi:putative DNA primase/helicase